RVLGADGAEEDRVGRRDALLRALGPLAAVLQVVLAAAGDLLQLERDAVLLAGRGHDLDGLDGDLGADAVAGERDDVIAILGGHGHLWLRVRKVYLRIMVPDRGPAPPRASPRGRV